jgi:hypothetical protein
MRLKLSDESNIDGVVSAIEKIRDLTSASYFIETGTFRGRIADVASRYFDNVYTIELSDELFRYAQDRFTNVRNVVCFHGDSKDVLGSLIKTIHPGDSIVYYLDAHYFVRSLTREERRKRVVPNTSPFPLMEELNIIAARKTTTIDVLVVDDMHMWGKESKLHPGWHALSVEAIEKQVYPKVMMGGEKHTNRYMALLAPGKE